jgi:hypothetical protein
MRTNATPLAEPAAGTLWRCGGRDCGAGECEHEENELHRHASGPGPAVAPPMVHETLRSAGAPLPHGVRRDMENRLGHDFSKVRIHTDAAAGASALAVRAEAYTVGRHVVFAPGRYDPASESGRRLIAHELAHAAASPQAAPVPTGELKVSSPDDPAERTADRVAASVTGAPSGSNGTTQSPTLHRSSFPETARDRYQHGGPLPYREATQFMSCMDIMNDRTYCEQEVLGIQTAQAQAPPQAPPATCVPSTALTWANFTGTPQGNSSYSALTSFSFSSQTSGGRDWIIATFNGGSSWVRPSAANPGSRAQNGCAPHVTSCQQFFDHLPAGQTGWQSLGPSTGCAASPQPDTSLRATSRGECDTVLGAECDRVAALESARLLHHEQLHFDLACAMAAKGNAALAASPAPNTQTILTAVRTKTNTQTSAFDTASNPGCNSSGQATWDTAVAQGLPLVTIP